MPRPRSTRLARVVASLGEYYGQIAPPPAKTAFALVLWEKVAYLADDARRLKAFALLQSRVGLTPRAILAAAPDVLREIAAVGGPVGVVERAQRMRDAAELVVGEFDGSLDNALALPLREARRALRKIYGIGEPGADKILLLTRTYKVLPLDSNGVRALRRIGYGSDHKNYSTMYKSVIADATPELVDDFSWLIDAHVLLRHHGQEICKTSRPRCEVCPIAADCDYAAAHRTTPRQSPAPR